MPKSLTRKVHIGELFDEAPLEDFAPQAKSKIVLQEAGDEILPVPKQKKENE